MRPELKGKVLEVQCHRCTHFQRRMLFNVCMHKASEYQAGSGKDYHTVQFMRSRGACGRLGTLFTVK